MNAEMKQQMLRTLNAGVLLRRVKSKGELEDVFLQISNEGFFLLFNDKKGEYYSQSFFARYKNLWLLVFLMDVEEMRLGQHTDAFTRSKATALDSKCFSLLLPTRSRDFIAPSHGT